MLGLRLVDISGSIVVCRSDFVGGWGDGKGRKENMRLLWRKDGLLLVWVLLEVLEEIEKTRVNPLENLSSKESPDS
jgi:hypothetical protein